MMRFSRALLDACIEAFTAVLPLERPADSVLAKFFRDHPHLGQRDRALVAESVYAALRRRRLLERLETMRAPRRLVLATWATLLGANMKELEPLARGDEFAWLGAAKREASASQPLEIECDFPDWLIERLRLRFDDTVLREIAAGLNRNAALDLRVNLMKVSRDAVLARLAEDGLHPGPTPFSPAGVRLPGRPAINRHPLFIEGAVEVQDEGSQLLSYLVAPRRSELVVDFCAGAGGKTLALGMLMRSGGRLYAFDVSVKRLAALKPRMARSGLSNVHPLRIADANDVHIKRLSGKIDRVLVDAPCSGLGTLRRNPDLKWRWTPDDINEMARKQRGILSDASRLLKPGGRLVYATCSILEEENRQVVEEFLARHADFRQHSAKEIFAEQRIPLDTGDYLETWPHVHGTDGFFAAVFERK